VGAQKSKKKFPLEEAYLFAEEHGGQLWDEVRSAREKRKYISKHEPNQASSVLRGRVIELFEDYGVLNLFVCDRWPKSLSEDPEEELGRCRRLLERYRETFVP
jgi:hypothetical protein